MENKTFTLIGKFDDQITKKLRNLNKEVEKLSKSFPKKNFASSIGDGLTSANKELKVLQDNLKSLNKFQFKFDKSGLQAATEEAKVLGKELRDISKAGLDIDRSGLQAAQQEARVLGDILKANALIKVGEGFTAAGAAGFASARGALAKAGQFIAARFSEAVNDQLQDIQARGSLFGSLNKEGLFSNAKDIKDAEKLRDINDDNYDITRNISRSMEGAIAAVVKSSTVSTATITILSRQLSDNLLPSLLKAKGVTDLSKFGGVEGRKELDAIMGGKKGVGTELAKLYEQMGSITSSPAMAGMTGMGFAQFLGSGSINRQLRIFETNPVLVDAMKQGLAKYGNTLEGRIKALKEGLEIAMPEAALMEARTTIAGGMQSISDTLTNAASGILSMGADISGQGELTLKMAKESGAFARQVKIYDKRALERREEYESRKKRSDEEMRKYDEKAANDRKRSIKSLTRIYQNADSPIEVIAATFGPLMQSFADMLGSSKNLFIDPINAIMVVLQPPLVQLQENIENLASQVKAGKSLPEALGRAVAEFFKSIATLFKPEGVADQAGSAIQKIFDDFIKGFKSLKGSEEFVKTVMDGITKLIMTAIFNKGEILGGLTPLGDALLKIFALLAAPAFISALISGIVPLVLLFGTQFLGGLAKKGLSKLLAGNFLKFPTGAPKATPPGPTQLELPLGGFTPKQLELPLGSTATAVPKASLFQRFTMFFQRFQGVGTRFMGFFKGFAGKLGIIGGIVTSVISLFSGESLARSLAQGAGPLLGAALGAALFPFLGPLGPLIGGWIGSLEPVVSFLEGVFIGLGQVFGAVNQTLGPIFEGLGMILKDYFSYLGHLLQLIFPFTSSLFGATKGMDAMGAVIIAVKVVLAPIVGAFQLLEQIINVVSSTFKYLIAGLVRFRLFLANLNPWGDPEEKRRLEKEHRDALNDANSSISKIGEANRRHMGYYTSSNAQIASSANNASTALNKVSESAKNYKPLSGKEAVSQGKASGLTPTASDMKWWRDSMAVQAKGLQVPPAVTQNFSNLGNKTSELTGTISQNSAQQKGHLDKLRASQTQALATEASIRKTWATVNTGSQSLLMRSANSLSSAINSAASKINSASVSLKGKSSTPGAMAANAYRGFVPGSSNRKMALDEAIASEMRNKPPGSHLLIANSSETVIPAAKGFVPKTPPLQGLAGSLSKYLGPLAALGSMSDQLKALRESSMFMGGGQGSLGAARALAAMFGLTMTSHVRPWSIGSYHQVGRAMDFSNSSGPTPQMMSYAQEMIKRYGSSLAELIYTPLGFSIKHGRKVPPLAAGAHYNHVHVAFGLGSQNPAFFSNQSDAIAWEKKMMPSSAKVSSVTTNSSEGFGNYTLSAPITIYQQPGQDPEELANLVATRLNMAINELRNHYA